MIDDEGSASAQTWTSTGDDDDDDASAEVPRGECVGRYLILKRLGAGAMGVVYEAYDPELDRRVAIKVLRGGDDESRRILCARLLREARTLAKLSHPNVVTIHDVGAAGERVFIAMERIAGVELGAWLRARPRGWRELRDVFVRAGRGLAAAHAAGLVHRDFKPANVLVGDDGEVRVVDFGLARAAGRDAREAAPEGLGALGEPGMTFVGRGVGTPAYMAPEVERDGSADAAADQYSFCVSLYEGLAGARPFDGASAAELLAAKRAGPPRAGLRRAPRWLRRAVLRGLAPDPADRFAGMEPLLDRLSFGPARRWALVAIAVALALAAGAALLVPDALAERRRRPCLKGQEEIAAVWSPPRRDAVRRALLATDAPYAARAWTSVAASVDAYAEGWAAMYERACVATAVDQVQSAALLDLRMACLRRRLAELDALARVLERADADTVARAVEGASRLTPIRRCADAGALLAQVAPPEGAATIEAVEAVRRGLTEAEALERVGRYADGLELARGAEARALAIGYAPVIAEARLRVGALLEYTGDYADASAALTSAAAEALAAGDDRIAAEAAGLATFTLGYSEGRLDGARAWRAIAEAALRRAGGDRREEALARVYWGAALHRAGALDEARVAYEAGLAAQQELLGDAHLEVAQTLNNLGTLESRRGDFAGSIDAHRRALEIRERALGPDHPDVATSLNNLGVTYLAHGDFAEALPRLRRALEIRERALDPTHDAIASARNNLGTVYMHLGEPEAALAAYQAALAGRPDDLTTATTLNNLGYFYVEQGDHLAAEPPLRRAAAITERLQGADHPDLINTLNNLGRALRGQGRCDEAVDPHARALAIHEARGVGRDETTAGILAELAAALRCAGRLDEARAAYARALALPALAGEPTRLRLGALSGLGRVELDLGDLAAADLHLEEALAVAAALDADAADLAELRDDRARARAAPRRAGR